jgi:hypothetical protein
MEHYFRLLHIRGNYLISGCISEDIRLSCLNGMLPSIHYFEGQKAYKFHEFWLEALASMLLVKALSLSFIIRNEIHL